MGHLYPHDDGVWLLDLAKFTVKEPNLETMCFLNDGNRGDENDTLALDSNLAKLLKCRLLYRVNSCFKFY